MRLIYVFVYVHCPNLHLSISSHHVTPLRRVFWDASWESAPFQYFLASTHITNRMADRCPICYTEQEDQSGGDLRPCCKKFVCKSCMERWSQINNYCPLCKAQMRAPEEVLTESLSALLRNLSLARDCLQRIESVAEHISQSDARSTDIRPIFTEVLDKGMKLGLFGSIPTMGPFNFGPQGEGIFGEAMSRDLISFMLAVGIRNTEPDFEIHFDVHEAPEGHTDEAVQRGAEASEDISGVSEDRGDDDGDEWEDVDD